MKVPMVSEDHQLHIFFFPLMAHGHMMPMTETAKLFAARGVRATLLLTPLNASMFEKTVSRSKDAGHPIEIQLLKFPCLEAGLPEGTENYDFLSTPEDIGKFLTAIRMLEKPFTQLVETQLPDCIVSDMFLPWTVDVAASFKIPRLAFFGTGFFSLCIEDSLRRFLPQKTVTCMTETFVVPGLPDPIELTKSQLPDLSNTASEFAKLFAEIGKANFKTFGVLGNTFYELESAYVEYFRRKMGKKAWTVGPVSLSNRNATEMAERGKRASIGDDHCLKWLDSKKPHSVLYICFGSLIRFTAPQLLEISMALESSETSFIWVVKNQEFLLLPEGFEERTKEKGLVIRGWSPQILILNHPSVGGFVTHCGWNSILEGAASGLPMITWPIFAEQFNNEKLVTKVLKIGVEVGSRWWVSWEEENRPIISREAIEEAVRSIMGDGEEARKMKEKAKELGEMAKRAVEKGGSSYIDLSRLIEELKTMHPSVNGLQEPIPDPTNLPVGHVIQV